MRSYATNAQTQREDFLADIRSQTRENRLLQQILYKLVGKFDAEKIIGASKWNEARDEWQVCCQLALRISAPNGKACVNNADCRASATDIYSFQKCSER